MTTGASSSVEGANWFDMVSDLESKAWWTNAKVERVSPSGGRPRWRVADTSHTSYQSALSSLGANLISKAVILTASIERQRKPGGSVCSVRLLLNHKTDGRETIWSAMLDPHTGEHRVQSNAYGAFAEVDDQVDAFGVTVIALATEEDIVDARAQIIPAAGLSLDDQGPTATGEIIVRDVAYRIVPLEEGRRMTLQFKRNEIRRERRAEAEATGSKSAPKARG